MPALNYTKFIDKVESGEKPCTIRAQRKVPIKVGDALYHYTGMRQKVCRRLIRKPVKCREALPIWIFQTPAYKEADTQYFVLVAGQPLNDDQIAALAKLDGFPSVLAFLDFFLSSESEVMFKGQLIGWKHPARKHIPITTRLGLKAL